MMGGLVPRGLVGRLSFPALGWEALLQGRRGTEWRHQIWQVSHGQELQILKLRDFRGRCKDREMRHKGRRVSNTQAGEGGSW